MNTQDYMSRFEDLMLSLRELSKSIAQEREKDERENSERRQEREEAARRGELGEDWKKIQERIDHGETTLSDVFSGKDTSDAAAALRHTARRNVTKAMQQARKDAPEGEDPFSTLQEDLSALSEETEQRIHNFRGF